MSFSRLLAFPEGVRHRQSTERGDRHQGQHQLASPPNRLSPLSRRLEGRRRSLPLYLPPRYSTRDPRRTGSLHEKPPAVLATPEAPRRSVVPVLVRNLLRYSTGLIYSAILSVDISKPLDSISVIRKDRNFTN